MSSITVLLIDDEQSLRAVIEEGLVELFGCTVRAVSDGESGLACLRESPSDVLLVDLLMPGINGFDVLERLQSGEERAYRPKRVIAMSALTDLDTVKALRDLGVDAILPKPFSLQELRLVLNLGEPEGFKSPAYPTVIVQPA